MDDEEGATLQQLQGHSITYRIAMGPQAGRKVLTVQTIRSWEEDDYGHRPSRQGCRILVACRSGGEHAGAQEAGAYLPGRPHRQGKKSVLCAISVVVFRWGRCAYLLLLQHLFLISLMVEIINGKKNPYAALGVIACASGFIIGTAGAGTSATTASFNGGLGFASLVFAVRHSCWSAGRCQSSWQRNYGV